MRHDNIEHRRLRPEPFTVEGDLAFVLRTFGLPEDMSAAAAEERFCSQEALVCSITGKSCVVTMWECVHGDEPKYTLEAAPVYTAKRSDVPTFGSSPVCTTGPHMGEAASKVDPWVKVGTTTIDGTLVDIANVLDVSSWPIDWDRDAVAAIDLFMRAQEPWLVGGRHFVAKRSHVNEHAGTAIIRCDIVRRLSECCCYCDRDHLTDAQRERVGECSSCSASIAAKMSSPASVKPTCPECGPHGNRGEVLLASSWARCTTCAGGKPGDLWGEVKVEESATYDKIGHHPGGGFPDDQFSIKESPDLSGPLTVTIGGRGFKVPTLIEMRGAALDDLLRHLTKNTSTRYDDATIAKWANIVCNLSPGDWIV